MKPSNNKKQREQKRNKHHYSQVVLVLLDILSAMRSPSTFLTFSRFLLSVSFCHAFLPLSLERRVSHSNKLQMNFFQDLLQGAFVNDRNLSKDKSKGQLEGPGDEESYAIRPEITETQRLWREKQQRSAAVTPDVMENTKWIISLFLAGVPSKDPSNDLYGSKTNISSRDRQLGIDIPTEPSVSLELFLLPGGLCQVSDSLFTSGKTQGQWKISEDGKVLRFSMDVLGYSRTIQTKGSITKVFWSNQEEVNTSTSTTYNIPPGWLYGDIEIAYGVNPGTFIMKGDGILRVEQRLGLLGAASKMVACGKFASRQNND